VPQTRELVGDARPSLRVCVRLADLSLCDTKTCIYEVAVYIYIWIRIREMGTRCLGGHLRARTQLSMRSQSRASKCPHRGTPRGPNLPSRMRRKRRSGTWVRPDEEGRALIVSKDDVQSTEGTVRHTRVQVGTWEDIPGGQSSSPLSASGHGVSGPAKGWEQYTVRDFCMESWIHDVGVSGAEMERGREHR
jgi:hypothetical protein